MVSAVFTAPSLAIFTDLLTGRICAPGRRTITAMITVADPAGRRAHDAYHRFVRDGAWSMHRGECSGAPGQGVRRPLARTANLNT